MDSSEYEFVKQLFNKYTNTTTVITMEEFSKDAEKLTEKFEDFLYFF